MSQNTKIQALPSGGVVHVITGLNRGGAEAVLVDLLRESGNSEYTHVISLMDEGVHGGTLQELGVGLTCLNMSQGKFSISAFLRLIFVLKALSPQVIQTWMYHANVLGSLASFFIKKTRIIWGIHKSDLDPEHNKHSRMAVIKIGAWISHYKVDAIISCSQRATKIHTIYGYDPKKFIFIPNGYDLERFRPDLQARKLIRQELEFSENKLLAGMIARFDPQKDHRNLLQAAQQVISELPHVCFLIVGPEITSDNLVLMSWIEELSLQKNVRLLGSRSDIECVYNALDVNVLSSAFGEAFPNVLSEAMACGIPCVSTDVGDSSGIIGDTGWIVPPKAPSALADSIIEALTEETEQREQRSQKCRDFILQNYSIDRMVARYRAVWNS